MKTSSVHGQQIGIWLFYAGFYISPFLISLRLIMNFRITLHLIT